MKDRPAINKVISVHHVLAVKELSKIFTTLVYPQHL